MAVIKWLFPALFKSIMRPACYIAKAREVSNGSPLSKASEANFNA